MMEVPVVEEVEALCLGEAVDKTRAALPMTSLLRCLPSLDRSTLAEGIPMEYRRACVMCSTKWGEQKTSVCLRRHMLEWMGSGNFSVGTDFTWS
ncbi:hypothetical protein TNCV_710341 [Trichonephila clavipes]|uniref:Uncharacterized protein n=1 Tax=Trichonephila clavipes TaxID=2585209 RepID=A0A8X6RHU7_TRICX|nr:hypothetical protein TNCV_710341 [Trichonephila clavipes]